MRSLLAIVVPVSLACGGGTLVEADSSANLDGRADGLGLGVCVQPARCGLIDREGHWVIAPEYRQVPDRCEVGCVLVGTDGSHVLVDVSGMPVQTRALEGRDHTDVSEGVLLVWPDGDDEDGSLWRVDGTVLIEGGIARSRVASTVVDPRRAQAPWAPGSPRTESFVVREGLAAILRDGAEYVHTDGTVAFHPGGRSVVHASGGRVVLGEQVYDLDGSPITSEATVVTPFWDGFARGLINLREGPEGETGDDVLVDTAGRIVARPVGLRFDRSMPLSGGRLSAWDTRAEQPVWLAADGSVTRPPDRTAQLWSFIEDRGMYGLDGQVGYLDGTGAVAIAADFAMPTAGQLEHAHFSEGLAVARSASTPDRAGYLGPDGSWAIEPQFDEARRFKDGVAWVTVEGVATWIRPDGSYLLAPDAIVALRED